MWLVRLLFSKSQVQSRWRPWASPDIQGGLGEEVLSGYSHFQAPDLRGSAAGPLFSPSPAGLAALAELSGPHAVWLGLCAWT